MTKPRGVTPGPLKQHRIIYKISKANQSDDVFPLIGSINSVTSPFTYLFAAVNPKNGRTLPPLETRHPVPVHFDPQPARTADAPRSQSGRPTPVMNPSRRSGRGRGCDRSRHNRRVRDDRR